MYYCCYIHYGNYINNISILIMALNQLYVAVVPDDDHGPWPSPFCQVSDEDEPILFYIAYTILHLIYILCVPILFYHIYIISNMSIMSSI